MPTMALLRYQMASVPAMILAIGGACINFYILNFRAQVGN